MSVRASSLDDLDLSDDCQINESVDEPNDATLPLTIEVPGKPPSLNAFYSGMHWSKRKKTRDTWHEKTALHAPDVSVKEYPVAVECVVLWGSGRRYDAENLAAGSKLITDGLVEAGVLRGDGPKDIRRVSLEARLMDGDGHLTRYTITEA
ncbi:hypothetical protein GGP94_003208 [Salinibacter ruber]|uniref:hypothetical protein n=1 Tax=Salinibacter ruber TaxID=146919 RepID=UPI002167E98E|nr:hypothetical protein [Salinibacter ruber]MCS4162760.1 hypothetical protein [Salinibacter ruber]